jgi:DNA ligase-1
MTSDQAFGAIETIAATASKNEKEKLIKDFTTIGDDLKDILVAGLDPFVTYGIAKVPEVERNGDGVFNDDTWLLLADLESRKLTGNAARDAVAEEFQRLSLKSAELLKRIITKDLRAGFSESTVNKAIPGLIRTFDCMLAHKFSDHSGKVKYPTWAEPKLDGVRVLAFVDVRAGTVGFFSRSGKEFNGFNHLKAPLISIVDEWSKDKMADADETLVLHAESFLQCVFDGEVVSGNFNKTVGDVRRKDEQATDAVFCAFDVLPAIEFHQPGKSGVGESYLFRRQTLEQMVPQVGPVRIVPKFKVESEQEIHALYEKVRAKGLEGLIIKNGSELYHRRRNAGWLKIKAEDSVDIPVVGAFEGEGKYVGSLGGLVCDFNGVQVNVGSGLTDGQRESFWKVYKTNPEQLIGRQIEVQYHEVTPDASLRHPRFVRFRDDKPMQETA